MQVHRGNIPLNSTLLFDIITTLGAKDRMQRQLRTLCPYLHYEMIDAYREMTVCGAYLDRMVLGSRFLHEVCETENHLGCEYFRNPRLKP